MLFSSLPFLFYFLPCALGLYFLAPRRLKNAALLLCSLVFYAWGDPRFVLFMAAAILQGYAAARLMERYPARRRLLLTLSAVLSLGLLGYCKYADFLISGFNAVTGLSVPLLRITLPIGISFYTFQILSYVIDVYRGDAPAQRSLIDLAAYIAMFPQLVAGPIVRYTDVAPQLQSRTHTVQDAALGARRFVLGLGKKVLLANVLYELVTVYQQSGQKTVLLTWMYAGAYMLHVYFDFSGYSMMAIGVGQMLGFELPQNFNLPYISGSATEFWRRWHITLGRWFRNNIYIPLGGNREGRWKTLRNTFCVWAFTGLWHGASWNFVLWGLIFFVLIMLEKNIYGKLLNKTHVFKHVYIIFLIPLTWMVFAISDMHQLATYFTRLFPFLSSDTVTANTRDVMVALHNYWKILIPCVLFSTPLPLHYYKKYRKSAFCIILLIVIFILSIRAMMTQTNNPFLYFQF